MWKNIYQTQLGPKGGKPTYQISLTEANSFQLSQLQEVKMLSQVKRHNTQTAIPVFSFTGKEVGEIVNGCLQKHVRLTRHLYRKYDGWTWDEVIIEKAIALDVSSIFILDDEKHLGYRVSMEDFRKLSIPVSHKKYGKQLCLPRCCWEVTEIPKKPRKSKAKHRVS
jgi:hypothetical protein